MESVDHGHEAEVNAEAGAALLAALRAWKEAQADAGHGQPGDIDDAGSDEEVA